MVENRKLLKLDSGFTLIELLAVIIILAIVALIATPIILDVIDEAERSANLSQAYLLLGGAENLYTTSQLTGEFINEFTGDIDIYDMIDTTGKRPEIGDITITKTGKIDFAVYIDGACYRKGLNDDVITPTYDVDVSECKLNTGTVTPDNDYACNASNQMYDLPVEIADAMTPIKIANDGTITKVSTTNTNGEWHNYCESNWANAVLLKDNVSKNDGDTILESEIAQMYVYIPRYKYEVFHSPTPITVNVEFQPITEVTGKDISLTSSPETVKGEFITHPAFYYVNDDKGTEDTTDDDVTQLAGLWVGKFNQAVDNRIIPNGDLEYSKGIFELQPLITSVNGMYGLDINKTDIHMVKNIEWGAITYLSQSKYGICDTESNESCDNFVIGSDYNWDGELADIVNETNKSTSYNISGIYDMVGKCEHVMAGDKNAMGGPYDIKYYDEYPVVEQDDYSSGILGDATEEMAPNDYNGKVWHENSIGFISYYGDWFIRSGIAQNGSGIFFLGGTSWGSVAPTCYARSAMWVTN